MDIVPDTGQLSQVMAQATAPAFILGAVAGFVSILLGRMTSVIDRIRSLNEIADAQHAGHLSAECARRCSLSWDLGARSSGCTTNTEPVSFLLSRWPCWVGRSSDSARR